MTQAKKNVFMLLRLLIKPFKSELFFQQMLIKTPQCFFTMEAILIIAGIVLTRSPLWILFSNIKNSPSKKLIVSQTVFNFS